MGSGSSDQAWYLHQVPDLVAAGFRVVTFENRGIAPQLHKIFARTELAERRRSVFVGVVAWWSSTLPLHRCG